MNYFSRTLIFKLTQTNATCIPKNFFYIIYTRTNTTYILLFICCKKYYRSASVKFHVYFYHITLRFLFCGFACGKCEIDSTYI